MIYASLVLVGLMMGSFANALVWRLKNRRDWIREHSECVHCHHVLGAKDLVPVLSWVWLKGKCRYCKKPISSRYPLVELATAALFVLSYAYWPLPFDSLLAALIFILWLGLLVICVALASYDFQYMLLPNKLVAAAGVLAVSKLLAELISAPENAPQLLAAALGGLAAFGGLFYLLFILSDGKWIGGGDVKLGFVLGGWLANMPLSLLAIFIGSLIGSILAAVMAAKGNTTLKSKLPFGPLLIAGFIIVHLFGQRLLDAYVAGLYS